jgi:hypothetical protein
LYRDPLHIRRQRAHEVRARSEDQAADGGAKVVQLLALAKADYDTYRPRIDRIANDMVTVEAKIEAIKKAGPTVANLTDVMSSFQELVDVGVALFDREKDAGPIGASNRDLRRSRHNDPVASNQVLEIESRADLNATRERR